MAQPTEDEISKDINDAFAEEFAGQKYVFDLRLDITKGVSALKKSSKKIKDKTDPPGQGQGNAQNNQNNSNPNF